MDVGSFGFTACVSIELAKVLELALCDIYKCNFPRFCVFGLLIHQGGSSLKFPRCYYMTADVTQWRRNLEGGLNARDKSLNTCLLRQQSQQVDYLLTPDLAQQTIAANLLSSVTTRSGTDTPNRFTL